MATLGASAVQMHTPPQRSPWHSPVPYLFGGLAAMLGLIAFALMILACSYWKLSGHFENRDERGEGEGDLEAGEKAAAPPPAPAEMEEKFLVIMAGQEKPTYLATPMSSRASSFGSKSSCSSDNTTSSDGSCGENSVKGGAPGTGLADQIQ
ncbi:glutamine dumper 3 [Striga asiatica]|uniref:Glutamine dumper 3 n=1 Tax=Striga asiatica TaxID=4170 RepID=A0A5A7R6V0_STRAF|nr:glutamine dumper 3 [Striga asiatica]